jgi:hypothetical protein
MLRLRLDRKVHLHWIFLDLRLLNFIIQRRQICLGNDYILLPLLLLRFTESFALLALFGGLSLLDDSVEGSDFVHDLYLLLKLDANDLELADRKRSLGRQVLITLRVVLRVLIAFTIVTALLLDD